MNETMNSEETGVYEEWPMDSEQTPDEETVASQTPDEETVAYGQMNTYWNEELAENFLSYLKTGLYPSSVGNSNDKRNFRKTAKDFVVQDDRLYYKNKRDGTIRIAISSEEDKQQIFKVFKLRLYQGIHTCALAFTTIF